MTEVISLTTPEEFARHKVASRTVTPPTMTAADTRANEHPEAHEFRKRRLIAKLKALRAQYNDVFVHTSEVVAAIPCGAFTPQQVKDYALTEAGEAIDKVDAAAEYYEG